MKTKKLRTLLIIILCFILAFTGCSKNENTVADVKTDSAASTDIKSAGTSEKSGPEVTLSVETKESTAPVEDIKYASADLEASAVMDSSKTYAAKTTGDYVVSEAEFSIKDDAGSIPMSTDDDFIPEEPIEPIYTEPRQITAGLLTAGEWNDNKNFDFLKNLISDGQSYTYSEFFTRWNLSPFNRLVIKCSANETSIQGAVVSVLDNADNVIWKGVTDHEGLAYAYYALVDNKTLPYKIVAEYNGTAKDCLIAKSDFISPDPISITFDEYAPKEKTLDLMFTIDTTGSMGDEIHYLQKELENVINRVKEQNANIPVRLSVNFYRDVNDTYVVRPYDFSEDIDTQLTYLNMEYAEGGGDFEEAVELALANAVNEHDWDENSIKLLFLVLDAPPHNTDQIKQSLIDTLQKASEKGIRIIPVASSGIDKDTEFLLRAFAMTTGGTYTFLTNDSGIGNSHIEPTVGEYTVEHLNDLLVRIISEYIS